MTSTSELDWERLPEELWLNHVFKHLAPATLSRVALVSKKMNRVATDPLLWAAKEISFNKEKIISARPFLGFLGLPRFTKIKSLDLSGQELSLQFAETLLRYINSNLSNISNLNLSNVKVLKGICGTPSRIWYNNANFLLPHFDFANEESSSSCTSADNSPLFCRMTITDLQYDEWRSLNENLFARAIAKLDESKLAAFVNAMPKSPRRPSRFVPAILRKVKMTPHYQSIELSYLDFTQVSPALFAEAVASLRRVKLLDCIGLTADHTTNMFSRVAKQDSVSLTSIIFGGNWHLAVRAGNPPEELARSVSKLKHLQFQWFMNVDQVQAILEAVPKSNLESLDIGMPSTTGVPMEIIRPAILHLNPGKNVTIPSKCVTLDDKWAIWALLCGNDVFFW